MLHSYRAWYGTPDQFVFFPQYFVFVLRSDEYKVYFNRIQVDDTRIDDHTNGTSRTQYTLLHIRERKDMKTV